MDTPRHQRSELPRLEWHLFLWNVAVFEIGVALVAILVWLMILCLTAATGRWGVALALCLPWGFAASGWILWRRERRDRDTVRVTLDSTGAELPQPSLMPLATALGSGCLAVLIAACFMTPLHQAGFGAGLPENIAIISILIGIGGGFGLPILAMLVVGILCGHARISGRGMRMPRTMAIAGVGTAIGLVCWRVALPDWRMGAYRSNDAGHLKSLGLACLMYSGDYDGYFPPDLATIPRTHYMAEGGVWACPTRPKTDGRGSPITGPCDYTYVGGGLKDDDATATRTVVAYTKYPEMLKGWINFLFVDGHAEGYPGMDPVAVAREHGLRLQVPAASRPPGQEQAD